MRIILFACVLGGVFTLSAFFAAELYSYRAAYILAMLAVICFAATVPARRTKP
jgi:hypothetical protein